MIYLAGEIYSEIPDALDDEFGETSDDSMVDYINFGGDIVYCYPEDSEAEEIKYMDDEYYELSEALNNKYTNKIFYCKY